MTAARKALLQAGLFVLLAVAMMNIGHQFGLAQGRRQSAPTIARLEELIGHCWAYSGQRDCGRDMMHPAGRELFDGVLERLREPGYEPPAWPKEGGGR